MSPVFPLVSAELAGVNDVRILSWSYPVVLFISSFAVGEEVLIPALPSSLTYNSELSLTSLMFKAEVELVLPAALTTSLEPGAPS